MYKDKGGYRMDSCDKKRYGNREKKEERGKELDTRYKHNEQVREDTDVNESNKKPYTRLEDLFEEDELEEVKKGLDEVEKEVETLEDGEEGAIKLDPDNPFHREWYEGR